MGKTKLALFPYPHIKRASSPVVPASKEDIARMIAKLELYIKIKLLSSGSRHRLIRQLKKEGKI